MATDNPFDTIESAQEFVRLLLKQVDDAKASIADDEATAGRDEVARQREALRLVAYKLDQLHGHLATSSRLLNDLRALRRLLLSERQDPERTGVEPVRPAR